MKLVRLSSLWDPSLSALAWSAALAGALALPSTAWGLGQAPEAPPPDAPSSTPNASPPAPQDPAAQPGLPAAAPPVAPSAAPEPTPAPPDHAEPSEDPGKGAITEEELKTLVVGKTLYLREGYLENTLSFDEHGGLVGHSPQGSYTLSLVEIEKVRMTKHKVELTGLRYGLHFLGARPDEDPTEAVDRVRITPKKKVLKITIDRELVITPKKKKHEKGEEKASAPAPEAASSPSQPDDSAEAKADLKTVPEEDRPADTGSVTTTTSPAHSAKLLRDAIDRIFAQGLDERMIAAMPSLWKLYYQAAANQADYRPSDPTIYRQSAVDQKARLLSTFEPPSNEYAQAGGVAGMALYHAIIGPDGKPQEIVVGRPIGFGLDESAAETIRKASFQPALKDGKPVAVMIDLVVQFRIYSKRTDQLAKSEAEAENSPDKLPGPYSVMHQ